MDRTFWTWLLIGAVIGAGVCYVRNGKVAAMPGGNA